MFAVPGWSLSPTLLKKQDQSSLAKDSSEKPSGTSKKRKRRGPAHEEVTSSNVGDLWSQHIEGVKPPPKEKKPKVGKDSAGETSKAVETAPTEEELVKQKQKLDRETEKADKRRAKNAKRSEQRAKKKTDDKELAPGTPAVPPPQSQSSLPPAAVSTVAKQELKLTPLQAAMRQKLISARFRHLNQTLYTAPSAETQTLFDTNPTFFEEYHSGFRQQVSTWPENPVDRFVEELMERGKVRDNGKDRKQATNSGNERLPALPRSKIDGLCTVADLGCGDAKLASQVGKAGKKLNLKILSYDLQSPNALVTKADIANLPLKDGSVNVAIFCLALMGTNWIDFVEEAWRVLRWKGELWVAEIKSRFGRATQKTVDHSVGKKRKPNKVDLQKQKQVEAGATNEQLMVEVDGADSTKGQTDVSAFVQVLRKRGFELHGEASIDLDNKMFVKMRFIKALSPILGKNVQESELTSERPGQKRQRPQKTEGDKAELDEPSVLKPCLYKVR